MVEQHFEVIKKNYDEFQMALQLKGKNLFKDTGIGFWGVTPVEDTFELFKRLDISQHKTFIDIGSGDGRIVHLASIFGLTSHGIEFDPELINTSLLFQRNMSLPHFDNVKFVQKDFMDHDLSGYDVVFISPDRPFFRTNLESKLKKELTGKLIVHGWEFQPQSFRKLEEHVINGDKFVVYDRQ